MKASDIKLLDFMKKDGQFIVPKYQRPYSWEEKHCEQLWKDIFDAGNSDEIISHFMGTIVYVQDKTNEQRLLIDGQQRITTISLLLIALKNALNSKDIPLKNVEQELMQIYDNIKANAYLFDPNQDGNDKFKLLLSLNKDKDALIGLINAQNHEQKNKKIVNNSTYFKNKISKCSENDLKSILKGLTKLVIVDIALDAQNDNPQRIFESLNSKGKLLTKADLIRNFIFMNESPKQQTYLYEQYWQKIEEKFRGDEKCFDGFMFHYLAMEKGDTKKGEVYEKFKPLADKQKDRETLLANLKTHASHYCYIMALQEDEDSSLKELFRELNQIPSEVTFPFLLRCYDHYQRGKLEKEEFKNIINLTISYIVRLSVCKKDTRSLNKTFFTFANLINPNKKEDENLPDSIYDRVIWHFAEDIKDFPTDEDFKKGLQDREIYKLHYARHLLERLENSQGDGQTKTDGKEIQIEHIMPQNPNKWKEVLNNNTEWESWEEEYKEYLHKLGNLTLTSKNQEYSNKTFEQKREGLTKSKFRNLNEYIATCHTWGKEQINKRGEILAEHALKIWIRPEQLSKPNKQKDSATKKQKQTSEIASAIYSKLKEQLDILGAKEEPTQEYTNYLLDGDFICSINFRKKYLNLYFNADKELKLDNLDFEVKKASKNKNGRGNMHIKLESLEDIPYCIDLIKQALAQNKSKGGEQAKHNQTPKI